MDLLVKFKVKRLFLYNELENQASSKIELTCVIFIFSLLLAKIWKIIPFRFTNHFSYFINHE